MRNRELQTRIARISEMPEEDRVNAPAELHQPHWDGLGAPHSWICTACWGDGWQTPWPCEIATKHGKAVAQAGGLDYSW